MTINWWTLGLQAVNVLILVWLLSRLFWRPVADAIARRQDAVGAMLDDANTAKAKATKALDEVAKTRAGLAAERDTLLAEAKTRAEEAAKSALAEASEKAEAILKAAHRERERQSEAARAKAAEESAILAVDIARKLLARLDTGETQAVFLELLVRSIDRMSQNDRAALVGTAGGIDLVSAVELDDAVEAKIAKAVGDALGGQPRLNFLTDPDLIAGFELRTEHFVLRDSWQSDLATILKDLKDAA